MKTEERKRSDKEQCKGPLDEDCEKCKDLQECLKNTLKWYTTVPQWLLDGYLSVLSPTALKVFMYLVRKANYNPYSNHFGRCWPSRKQIAEATGVSKTNLSRQLKELEDEGLIRRGETMRFVKPDGSFGSTVTITVTFFGRMKELKEKKK